MHKQTKFEKEETMINQTLLRNLTLGLAILSVASVAAFAKNSRTLSVTLPASLNGVQIAPGKYTVSWETQSPEVTVTFSKGRKVIVTAEGRLVERDVKYRDNMVVYRTNPDGSNTIRELRFGGKNQVIVFDQ